MDHIFQIEDLWTHIIIPHIIDDYRTFKSVSLLNEVIHRLSVKYNHLVTPNNFITFRYVLKYPNALTHELKVLVERGWVNFDEMLSLITRYSGKTTNGYSIFDIQPIIYDTIELTIHEFFVVDAEYKFYYDGNRFVDMVFGIENSKRYIYPYSFWSFIKDNPAKYLANNNYIWFEDDIHISVNYHGRHENIIIGGGCYLTFSPREIHSRPKGCTAINRWKKTAQRYILTETITINNIEYTAERGRLIQILRERHSRYSNSFSGYSDSEPDDPYPDEEYEVYEKYENEKYENDYESCD